MWHAKRIDRIQRVPQNARISIENIAPVPRNRHPCNFKRNNLDADVPGRVFKTVNPLCILGTNLMTIVRHCQVGRHSA